MAKLERLFFDLETVADYDAVLTLPDPRPPKNYKDPEKIEKWVEDAKVKQVEKAALDPHTGKIAALGWATNPHGDISTTIARDDEGDVSNADESELITRFWDLLHYTEGRNVGWNNLGFDLPYLMIRSFALQVEAPKTLPKLGKYMNDPTTDLMGILSNWSWDKTRSLKWAAERYEWTIAAPAVDGSMIDEINNKQLEEYVASDVHIIQQAYADMGPYFFAHE